MPEQTLRPGTRQIYSASRLSAYESCPRQYKFRYLDRMPRTEESIETFLGSRVHEALLELYRAVRLGKDPTLTDLLHDYYSQWSAHWHDRVKIVKQNYSIDHYKQFGERCLTNYYRAHQPFNHGQTLGLEHQVTTSLDADGRYRIQGYIDRLVRVGSRCYEIHDYKTSGRLPGQEEIDADRQLALYQLAVEGMWPDTKEVELVWHYLAFGRELRSRRTPTALEKLRGSTIALIDRIEADTELPPIKSGLCHWCAYQGICPLWKDHLVAQDAAQGLDPQSISREALREAILVAAQQEGAEVRFAEHGQLWVRVRQPVQKAAQDGKADGWVRLSDEDVSLLFRQVELARWSATLVEKLQRYLALLAEENRYEVR